MKRDNRMSVSEMDTVNSLIMATNEIERLSLSERERALAYFDFIQRDVEADLALYAAKFDILIKEASSREALMRLRESALRIRRHRP